MARSNPNKVGPSEDLLAVKRGLRAASRAGSDVSAPLSDSDRAMIHELLARACLAADSYAVEGFADVFAGDAVLSRPSAVHEGRAAILAHAERRTRERDHQHRNVQHRVTNMMIDGDGTCASVLSYVEKVGVRSSDGVAEIILLGWYEDEVRKTDGRWLIHRRTFSESLPGSVDL